MPKVWRLLGVVAVLSFGLGMSTAGHAESYEDYINRVIERAKTDDAFAARVREAGPQTYPLVVLLAAGYDWRSAEAKRAYQLDSQGGNND